MLISPTILPNLVIIGKRNVEIWTKLLKTTLLPAFSLWMDLYGELIMDLTTKKHYLYLNNTHNAWNVLIYLTFFKVVTNIIASLRGTWSVHCVAYTFVNRYCYCIMCCYILSDFILICYYYEVVYCDHIFYIVLYLHAIIENIFSTSWLLLKTIIRQGHYLL